MRNRQNVRLGRCLVFNGDDRAEGINSSKMCEGQIQQLDSTAFYLGREDKYLVFRKTKFLDNIELERRDSGNCVGHHVDSIQKATKRSMCTAHSSNQQN